MTQENNTFDIISIFFVYLKCVVIDIFNMQPLFTAPNLHALSITAQLWFKDMFNLWLEKGQVFSKFKPHEYSPKRQFLKIIFFTSM